MNVPSEAYCPADAPTCHEASTTAAPAVTPSARATPGSAHSTTRAAAKPISLRIPPAPPASEFPLRRTTLQSAARLGAGGYRSVAREARRPRRAEVPRRPGVGLGGARRGRLRADDEPPGGAAGGTRRGGAF